MRRTYIRKAITAASAMIVTFVVSVSAAAIASPTHTTTSGQPAVWKFGQTQMNAAPKNPVAQPAVRSQNSKPNDTRREGEVKSIKAQAPSPVTAAAKRCTGDARFANPPVVNNPHHVRNVVWRNMRMMCAS